MIGVDIDGRFLDALRAYFNLRWSTGYAEVYKTRKGWHVVNPYLELDGWRALKVRMALGDDPDRVYVSELRARIHKKEPEDILFERKFYGGRVWERRKVELAGGLRNTSVP